MEDLTDRLRGILGGRPNWPHVPPSPDCKAGKHTACDGAAWDFANDEPSPCLCDCHVQGVAA